MSNRFLQSAKKWIAATIILVMTVPAFAEHHGLVKFAGLPVPGATVTATHGDQTFTAVTDERGMYSFPNLPGGSWAMTLEMQAFATQKRDVGVGPNPPPTEWELQMLPFDALKATAVTVSDPKAPAPAPAPGATAAAPSTAFKKTDVKEAAGAPAAKPPTAGTDAPAPGSSAASTDEAQTQNAADAFLINGSTNNGAASPFGMSGAFGNNRRGPRSLYNGNIGLTFDNSRFDARTYSLTGQTNEKPNYNHVTGLFSFGGPLKIPHVLKNGPNITVNYQWVRNRNVPSLQPTFVPDALQRAGNFSETPNQIFDPSTGLAFANNVIPQSRFSPQALALLSLYPLPNFTSANGYNYQIPLVANQHVDAFQGRANKAIGRMNTLSGQVQFQSVRADSTNLLGFLDTNGSRGLTSSVSWVHRFTPRLFMTTGFSYSRQSIHSTPFFAAIGKNVSGQAGITGNDQTPNNYGPPTLNFASIASLSDGISTLTRNQTNAISGNLFWSHSPHNITVGGDFRKLQNNLRSQQDPRGTLGFNGTSTGNGTTPGSDLAGFLLGIPDTASIAFGNADKYFRYGYYDLYANDDWRVGPGLTLNYGLRWDYNTPITEKYGRLVNLNIAPGFTAATPVIAGPGNSLINPDRHGFEPSFGFAWHPILASSLVVRGGYSLRYDTSAYNNIATQMAQQSPLSTNLSVTNTGKLTLANPFIAPPGLSNTFAVDPNFLLGYAQNWQLSAQRDLPAALIMKVTYSGIKGTRGRQEFLPNTFPGTVNPCPACPIGFAYLTSNGNSTREAGNIQVRRRLHNGLGATIDYTYSKSIDDATLGGRGGGGQLIAQDWRNLSGERGLSPFDQRHLASLQVQYSTGVGAKGGTLLTGWRGAAYKDWTITSTITKGSGLPLTPLYQRAVVGTGVTGSIRPNFTGADIYAAPSGRFLNLGAFSAPLPGQWGNAGRDTIIGPGQFSLNAQMQRTFRLNDRFNADLRFDAANLLNHVTFQSWNTTVTSAQFGLPTTANNMRSVQTTFRLRF